MTSQNQTKQASWQFVFSVISFSGSLIAAVISYSTAISTMDKRLEVLQIKQGFFVEGLNEVKKELKESREQNQKQFEKVTTSMDEVKTALLTNRKIDDLKTLIIGAGIGRGQVDKILEEGLKK